jgi:predicted histidine transporter YuiF (NhaC family)
MFQRFVDDMRVGAGVAIRLATLAVAAGVSLFITTCFLAAAAFVFVLEREGAVAACLASAAVFLVVTLIAAVFYIVKQNQNRKRLEQAAREAAEAAKQAKAQASSLLTDPATLAIGLQLVRTIGVRRMIPILAIGGVVLGLLAARKTQPTETDEG